MQTEDRYRRGIAAILCETQVRLVRSVSTHSEIGDVAAQSIRKQVPPVPFERRSVPPLGERVAVERHAAPLPRTIRKSVISLRSVHVQVGAVLHREGPAENRDRKSVVEGDT